MSEVIATTSPVADARPAAVPVSDASTEFESPASGRRIFLIAAMTSVALTACALLAYDHWVREPRTPRLGTVDVGQIFAANQALAIKKLLSGATNVPADALGAQAGQDMATQLQDFSRRCGCLLIASPAVFGGTWAVPDYTAAIRAAYALTVDPADFRVPVSPPGLQAPGLQAPAFGQALPLSQRGSRP